MPTQSDHGIAWTDRTWNPVRGCSRVSAGCTNCYAERQAARFAEPGQPFHAFVERHPKPHWTGKVELIKDKLREPFSWKSPQRVFVNSMSDLFHEDLTKEEISLVFAVMACTPHVTYQVLTKRALSLALLPRTLREASDWLEDHIESVLGQQAALARWPLPNVWLGVSVEHQQAADERIPHLMEAPAAVRFLSCEPLLGPVQLQGRHTYCANHSNECLHIKQDTWCNRRYPDWVIVGGESGPGARPMDPAWARSLREQCRAAAIPCFIKQLGAAPEGLRLRDRKGGDPAEWPEDLRVRQFPEVLG